MCQLTVQDSYILKLDHISSKNFADNLRLATINFKTSADIDFKLAKTDGNLKLANITSYVPDRRIHIIYIK